MIPVRRPASLSFRRIALGARRAGSRRAPSPDRCSGSLRRAYSAAIAVASAPQKSSSPIASVGTPNTPRAIASSVLRRSASLTSGDAMRCLRVGHAELAHQLRPLDRQIPQPPIAPDEAEDAAHRVGLAVGGDRKPQQRQRIERMHGGKLERDAELARLPHHEAIGERALGGDLGRPLLPVRLEQSGEQHRPIADRDASARARRAARTAGTRTARRNRNTSQRWHRDRLSAALDRRARSARAAAASAAITVRSVRGRANRSTPAISSSVRDSIRRTSR